MDNTFKISDSEAAKIIAEKLTASFELLGETILLVNRTCSADDAQAYRQRVGDAFYTITFKLLEPIYAQHPMLKPTDWT